MKLGYLLWEKEKTQLEYYRAEDKRSDAAVLIFPGGGYVGHTAHEGQGYAEMFNSWGISAFVLNYRVTPDYFPKPLLDARRAIRFIRANAEKFGVDKRKILVIGSSAGGHLAALLSTYTQPIDGESNDFIDRESYMPNAQILCYPVISSDEDFGHIPSYQNLLGDRLFEKERFDPILLTNKETPQAFIWHTATDSVVNVTNSYRYAEALSKNRVPCELHIYPIGEHGGGRFESVPYVAQWTKCLESWLQLFHYMKA